LRGPTSKGREQEGRRREGRWGAGFVEETRKDKGGRGEKEGEEKGG